jgi:hypothetical protein
MSRRPGDRFGADVVAAAARMSATISGNR